MENENELEIGAIDSDCVGILTVCVPSPAYFLYVAAGFFPALYGSSKIYRLIAIRQCCRDQKHCVCQSKQSMDSHLGFAYLSSCKRSFRLPKMFVLRSIS